MDTENARSINVEVHNVRFENFTEQRRFDLVLMVHSFYYLEDPKEAIESALNLLDVSGKLVILIASDDTLNELASAFLGARERQFDLVSEDLSSHLEKRGIEFECQRIEAKLDITSCFEPLSEHGARMADFVSQVLTGELPPHLRRKNFQLP